MFRSFSILFLALVSFGLTSCAQQRVVINKKLTPFAGLDQVTPAAQGSAPVSIESVSDARANRDVVGEARTGARFTPTPVYLESKTEDFFKAYFENALRARGFTVVDSDAEATLEVTISEMWVEEVLERFQPERAKCKVSIELKAKKERAVYTGEFWSETLSPGDLGDATEKLQPTLASCLNSIMEKIAGDEDFAEFVKGRPLI